MIDQRIYSLLKQYADNTICERDRKELKSIIEEIDDKTLLLYIDSLWNEFQFERQSVECIVDEIKQSIDEQLLPYSAEIINTKRIPAKLKLFYTHPLFRYATATVTLIIVSILFYIIVNDENVEPENRDFFAYSLSDGEDIIIIANSRDTIEVADNNIELQYDNDGSVSVNEKIHKPSPTTSQLQTNQLYVPYGKMTSIIMSDGSKVWVNSGTHLIYPSVFTDKKREIFVDGEIYLEVAKKENSAFIVKTSQLDIEVLGTAFNISAYKNDETQSVVLATGAVSIKKVGDKESIKIEPQQKYSYQLHRNIFTITEVDVFDNVCWKHGFSVFKNESLANVLKKVERHYNIPIEYDALYANSILLSGKLDLKEDIVATLKNLTIAAPIDYTYVENQNKIYVNPLIN